MRIVIDADGRAVIEADARRTLDLREQQVGLVLEVTDFEATAFDRAVLDLGAVVIGHQLAAADLAEHLATIGQADRTLGGAADEQIGRPAIDRHLVDLVLRPRAVDDGLVIAGDKPLAFAKPRNAQGKKMLLEESFRLQAIRQFQASRDVAGIAQRSAERLRIGRRHSLRRYRPAAHSKRVVGGEMIVLVPARDLGPGDRRILAAGNLKREFKRWIRQMTDGRRMRGLLRTRITCRKGIHRGQRTRQSDHAKHEPRKASRLRPRFQCQPASSSDRESSCRGRMSRHR